jgi:hypothetical protein
MDQATTPAEREHLAALFGFDSQAAEAARGSLSQLPVVSAEAVAALRAGLSARYLGHALACAGLLEQLGLEVDAANERVVRFLFEVGGCPNCRDEVYEAVEEMARHRLLQAAHIARLFAQCEGHGRALGVNALCELPTAVVAAYEVVVPHFKQAVVDCIGDARAEVRDEVVDSLAGLMHRAAVDPLDAWIIREDTHINALRRYLYHVDMGVQLAAARALGLLGVDEPLIADVALSSLASVEVDVRTRAADVLGQLPGPDAQVAGRLAALLRDQREWDAPAQGILSERICATNELITPLLEVAATAYRAHGTVDGDLVAFVLGQCRHEDAEARGLAIGVLRELGVLPWRVAGPLEDALGEASPPRKSEKGWRPGAGRCWICWSAGARRRSGSGSSRPACAHTRRDPCVGLGWRWSRTWRMRAPCPGRCSHGSWRIATSASGMQRATSRQSSGCRGPILLSHATGRGPSSAVANRRVSSSSSRSIRLSSRGAAARPTDPCTTPSRHSFRHTI